MIPRRYLVVVATFLLSFLLYVDRVCIATAKGPIMADLHLTNIEFGWVLSVFGFGYALLQTPSGILADRLGARRVLTIVVTAWSVFTGMTALAWNFTSLLAIRFLFGAGEAGAFPGMARSVYSWIPVKERGIVKGINFSASRLGAAATMPLLPLMIQSIGWRNSFYFLMVIGFVWAGVWWWFYRDEPAEHPRISPEELALIHASRQGAGLPASTTNLPILRMLGSVNLWLMMVQYVALNFTTFFCLTWLFPYVQERYHLKFTEAGFYTMIPLVCGAVGNVSAGWLVDRMFSRGQFVLSRRLPAIIGLCLAAIGLVVSVQQDGVVGAVFWLSIAVFGADMVLSPSWSFCIDIGGRHAGQVSGTMNMAGNLSAAAVAIAFPYLLRWTGGPKAFFFIGAGLSVMGACCWIFADPSRKIEPVTHDRSPAKSHA